MLAVLAVILLEPVLAWTLDLEKSGRIVVAVDVSQSMETKDEQASSSEKLRTAQALGLLSRDAPVEEWCKAYDVGKEPEWASVAEESDPNKLKALIDSRREMARGAIDEVSKLDRVEIARRILQSGPNPLLKDLEKLGKVELCLFAGQSTQLEPELLEKPLEPPGDAIQWTKTDLMQVMTASPAERGGLKLAGVVLLTDGRDNAHTGDAEYLQRFAGGAPIQPGTDRIGAPAQGVGDREPRLSPDGLPERQAGPQDEYPHGGARPRSGDRGDAGEDRCRWESRRGSGPQVDQGGRGHAGGPVRSDRRDRRPPEIPGQDG